MTDTIGRTIYVGDAAEINENDVESARAYHGDGPSFVEITLKPVAAERFLYLTRGHVGQPLAIFVNGRLVSAPIVQDVVTNGRAYVSGQMTADEANALAASIGDR